MSKVSIHLKIVAVNSLSHELFMKTNVVVVVVVVVG